MSYSGGKGWPGNVPAEAEAARMLLGQSSPGEFESVVNDFRAAMSPEERAMLDVRSDAAWMSAMTVKWRLTAAIAVAPVNASEVDAAALAALQQEASDAAFGLSGAAASASDPARKQLLEGARRSVDQLLVRLKAAAPRAPGLAPPVAATNAPAPAPLPTEAPRVQETKKPAEKAAPSAPRSLAEHEEAQGRKKAILLAGAAALALGAGVHGYRFLVDQAEQQERAAREASLPAEHSAGDVTHITLRGPSAEKVAELEARAQREGKRLLKITATEYQLVGPGTGAEPPAPPKEGEGGAP